MMLCCKSLALPVKFSTELTYGNMDLTAYANGMTSTKSSIGPSLGIGVSALLPADKNAGILLGGNFGFESPYENHNTAQISYLKAGLYGKTGRLYLEFGLNYSFWILTSASIIYGKPGYQVLAGLMLTDKISMSAKYLVLNCNMPVPSPPAPVASVDFRASQLLLCLTMMN